MLSLHVKIRKKWKNQNRIYNTFQAEYGNAEYFYRCIK